MLWQAFYASPLFGDASYRSNYEYTMTVGGHLFWMSRLALWGISGFILFIWLLYKNFRIVYYFLNSQVRYYYLLSVLAFIALGLVKNLNFVESFLVLFLIIPGFYTAKGNLKNASSLEKNINERFNFKYFN